MRWINWKYWLLTAKLAILPLLLPAQNAPVTSAAILTGAIPGTRVTIPVTVSGFTFIGSVSLSLDYDYTRIQYISAIINPMLTTSFAIGDNDLGNGLHRLMIGWFGPGVSLPEGSWIVNLDFNYISGSTSLHWFDNGPSCSFGDGDAIVLNDVPASTFYMDGQICGVIANAGIDTTILYESSALLHAAPGGAGSFSYHWSPENLLTDPDMQNPQTIVLTATTIFMLTVTDQLYQCEATDYVVVTTVGGPLSSNPTVIPGEICPGLSARLFSNAGGGSGNYKFSWTCIPPGNPPWSSILENPMVSPDTSTLYHLVVSDSNSTVSGDATLVVLPGPPTPVISKDTNTLISSETVGNQWYRNMIVIPGATGKVYFATQSGTYFVICSNSGCSSDTSNFINVVITSINDHEMNLFTIYPNPVKDNFTVRFADYAKGEYTLMICSVVGKQERVLNFNINGGEHEHEVEVGDLAAGIHFVLIDDKYSTYVQKLVIF
jgi:hypothetical protein